MVVKAYRSLKASLTCNLEGSSIIGREEETNTLKNYLQKHLKGSLPGSLYISGAPGTGKTAVITKIISELKVI